MTDAWVEITRGPLVESRHRVHVAVAHAQRGLIAAAGDPRLVTFVRSAIKMFQTLPLVEDGGVEQFALTPEELALCSASHNAEPFHVTAARSILAKAGVPETALACGPHAPMYPAAAADLLATGTAPDRIHNNCSGKHAGMLALCALNGWAVEGYHLRDHPAQQRVLSTLTAWTADNDTFAGARRPGTVAGDDGIATAIDGCGLPTFALPLDRVALACARIAAASLDNGGAPARVINAMTSHPEYVAGTGRLCTDLMRLGAGRIFAKTGAEGYYCAGAPESRLGIALKVEDGAKRASEPVLLAVLHALDLLTTTDLDALDTYARPRIFNTRNEHVGDTRVLLDLRQKNR